MPARRVVAVAVAAVLAAGTACGNSEPEVNKRPHTGAGTATVVDGVQQITVSSGTDLRFHPSTLTVHQGKVRIVLENAANSSSGPPHNLHVMGLPGAAVPLTAAGDKKMITFTAPAPGRYRFVCTIHLAQGQTGMLVVKAGTAS